MISGIYKIENIINNKIYIGSSIHIKRRFKQHKYHLKNNKHTNQHLQNSWNKYGSDNFKFSIIEICHKHQRLSREQYYINLYDFKNLYNIVQVVIQLDEIYRPVTDVEYLENKFKENKRYNKLNTILEEIKLSRISLQNIIISLPDIYSKALSGHKDFLKRVLLKMDVS